MTLPTAAAPITHPIDGSLLYQLENEFFASFQGSRQEGAEDRHPYES